MQPKKYKHIIVIEICAMVLQRTAQYAFGYLQFYW